MMVVDWRAISASVVLLCASGAAAPVPGQTSQRSDTVVVRAGTPVHPGIASIREELTIGKDDPREEYMIVALSDFAFGPDGSYFVADRGSTGRTLGASASIRQYDSTGKFIRRIGRGGQGPGEFSSFGGMSALPDGRLVMYDGTLGRVNIWSRTGTHLTSWPAPKGLGSAGFVLKPNGDSYIRASAGRLTAGAPPPTMFVRFNIQGEALDTIFEPPQPDLPNNRLTASRGSIPVPFMPTFMHWFSPLGYYVAARTDRYAINLYQPIQSGQTPTSWKPGNRIVSIQKNGAPVPVTAVERTAWRDSIESRMRRTQPGWTWNGPDIPRTKPYFLMLMTDLDGRIWARVMNPAQQITPDVDIDDAAENLWDVFEPSGRYLGAVRTRPGTLPSRVKGDRVLAVSRDANDVQHVVVGRIVWGR